MHDAPHGTLNNVDRDLARVGDSAQKRPSGQGMGFVQRAVTNQNGNSHSGYVEKRTLSPFFHAYAVFMAISVLVLICSGGLVTSTDSGLAVPDWPTSFGYNMFAFPLSRWLAPGGVRLEHSHRLIATFEGILTITLAIWAWKAEGRRWVRLLSYATLGAIVVQGVLGGMRVVYRADWIGIIHGCVAQAFLALTAFIALVTSAWWVRLGVPDDRRPAREVLAGLLRKLAVVTLLIYLQLALGASMRHAHAGLSIPDFPKAYGNWWPHVTRANLPAINQEREKIWHQLPTTVAQVHLQMTHRLNAALILCCVVVVAVSARRHRENLPRRLRLLCTAGVGLVAIQITLGMYTIWTNKAADVATAHVAVGALLLVWGVVCYAALRRWVNGSVVQGRAEQPRREMPRAQIEVALVR